MAIEFADLRDADKVKTWYREHDDQIMRRARDWPAAWGGNYRVDDCLYVSMDDFEDVLPSPEEQALWSFLANEGPNGARPAVSYDDVLPLLARCDWLEQEASRVTDSDEACCYYTDEDPESLDVDELIGLANERPDLFRPEDLRDHHCLIWPALKAGLEVSVEGEPTWASLEENDLEGIWSETELRGYFHSCEDLADEKADGTTFEDWLADNERMGLFTRTSEGRGNPTLAETSGSPSALGRDAPDRSHDEPER